MAAIINNETTSSVKERYQATLVVSAVGDALGYCNGRWEFCKSGTEIHKDFESLGGLDKIDLKGWKVSDDTVMHVATAEALIESFTPFSDVCKTLGDHYVLSFKDMIGRAPGSTTAGGIHTIKTKGWDKEPYNSSGGGCGGSMRAMCIGLKYCGEDKRKDLIGISIESGRMTHNNPIGFFGAMVSAVFTAFAVEDVPVVKWGRKLLSVFPMAYEYLETCGRDWGKYQDKLTVFEDKWRKYREFRHIAVEGQDEPVFPESYDVAERDDYYNSLSWRGWGGASGDDSVIISYDALLGSRGDFREFCLRGVLHGGDNDSTGAIGGAWFGAYYGFKGVPESLLRNLEYRSRLEAAGDKLYSLTHYN